uniref:Uncharacterized protein n=1 Tax=Romanomermis culicivorax TaxID=13658 RepID=A0A915HLT4_ROMCU
MKNLIENPLKAIDLINPSTITICLWTSKSGEKRWATVFNMASASQDVHSPSGFLGNGGSAMSAWVPTKTT